MIIKLSKKCTFGDEIKLNFDKLNGLHLIKAEREAKRNDPGMVMPATSFNYQVALAGQACENEGVTAEDIKALPAKDFQNIVQAAQAFLLGVDSEDQEPESSES